MSIVGRVTWQGEGFISSPSTCHIEVIVILYRPYLVGAAGAIPLTLPHCPPYKVIAFMSLGSLLLWLLGGSVVIILVIYLSVCTVVFIIQKLAFRTHAPPGDGNFEEARDMAEDVRESGRRNAPPFDRH